MRQYVDFTLHAPTCIAQRPTAPGQPTETLTYLSGTVIRGGLATLYLRGQRYEDLQSAERDCFRSLFLNEEVVFGNAWPRRTLNHDSDVRGETQIVPRTAWTHKRRAGWQGDQDGNGVRDALTALIAGTTTEEAWSDWDELGQEFVDVHDTAWCGIDLRRRLISRTALTHNQPGLSPRMRGVAADGQLYSFEALETGQDFRSVISGPEDQIAALRQLVSKPTLISVGQGRSRGMGRVEVRLANVSEAPPRMTARLAAQARDFTARTGRDPHTIVLLPITLLSDAILRDNYLLPCSSGDPQITLSRYLPLPTALQQMTLRFAVQRTRWIGGWDELRRLPRAPQLAVQQGSVWVYEVPAELLDTALAWWSQAEIAGIGERRSEGFGQIRLLHPLHREDIVR